MELYSGNEFIDVNINFDPMGFYPSINVLIRNRSDITFENLQIFPENAANIIYINKFNNIEHLFPGEHKSIRLFIDIINLNRSFGNRDLFEQVLLIFTDNNSVSHNLNSYKVLIANSNLIKFRLNSSFYLKKLRDIVEWGNFIENISSNELQYNYDIISLDRKIDFNELNLILSKIDKEIDGFFPITLSKHREFLFSHEHQDSEGKTDELYMNRIRELLIKRIKHSSVSNKDLMKIHSRMLKKPTRNNNQLISSELNQSELNQSELNQSELNQSELNQSELKGLESHNSIIQDKNVVSFEGSEKSIYIILDKQSKPYFFIVHTYNHNDIYFLEIFSPQLAAETITAHNDELPTIQKLEEITPNKIRFKEIIQNTIKIFNEIEIKYAHKINLAFEFGKKITLLMDYIEVDWDIIEIIGLLRDITTVMKKFPQMEDQVQICFKWIKNFSQLDRISQIPKNQLNYFQSTIQSWEQKFKSIHLN